MATMTRMTFDEIVAASGASRDVVNMDVRRFGIPVMRGIRPETAELLMLMLRDPHYTWDAIQSNTGLTRREIDAYLREQGLTVESLLPPGQQRRLPTRAEAVAQQQKLARLKHEFLQQHLSAQQRDMVRLRVAGKTEEEIAETVGLRDGSGVGHHFERILKRAEQWELEEDLLPSLRDARGYQRELTELADETGINEAEIVALGQVNNSRIEVSASGDRTMVAIRHRPKGAHALLPLGIVALMPSLSMGWVLAGIAVLAVIGLAVRAAWRWYFAPKARLQRTIRELQRRDYPPVGELELPSVPVSSWRLYEQIAGLVTQRVIAPHLNEAEREPISRALSGALREVLSNAVAHGNKLEPNRPVRIAWTIGVTGIEVSVMDTGDESFGTSRREAWDTVIDAEGEAHDRRVVGNRVGLRLAVRDLASVGGQLTWMDLGNSQRIVGHEVTLSIPRVRGQIGNRGQGQVIRRNGGLMLEVFDAARSDYLLGATPLTPASIQLPRVVRSLRQRPEAKVKAKGVIDAFLAALQHAPPSPHTFAGLYADVAGHPSLDHRLISLHESLAQHADPAVAALAWFHELGEYLAGSGRLRLALHNSTLTVSLPSAEPIIVVLGKEALEIAQRNPRQAHYLLWAMQRQLFPRLDQSLSEAITGLVHPPQPDTSEAILAPLDPAVARMRGVLHDLNGVLHVMLEDVNQLEHRLTGIFNGAPKTATALSTVRQDRNQELDRMERQSDQLLDEAGGVDPDALRAHIALTRVFVNSLRVSWQLMGSVLVRPSMDADDLERLQRLSDNFELVDALLAEIASEPRPEPTDIVREVHAAVRALPEHIRPMVYVQVEDDVPLAWARQLRVAVRNLALNAGQTLLREGISDPRIEIIIRRSGVDVQDNGPGFPATWLDEATGVLQLDRVRSQRPGGHGIGLERSFQAVTGGGGQARGANRAAPEHGAVVSLLISNLPDLWPLPAHRGMRLTRPIVERYLREKVPPSRPFLLMMLARQFGVDEERMRPHLEPLLSELDPLLRRHDIALPSGETVEAYEVIAAPPATSGVYAMLPFMPELILWIISAVAWWLGYDVAAGLPLLAIIGSTTPPGGTDGNGEEEAARLEAIAQLEALLSELNESQPDYLTALMEIGDALHAVRAYERALEIYQRAMRAAAAAGDADLMRAAASGLYPAYAALDREAEGLSDLEPRLRTLERDLMPALRAKRVAPDQLALRAALLLYDGWLRIAAGQYGRAQTSLLQSIQSIEAVLGTIDSSPPTEAREKIQPIMHRQRVITRLHLALAYLRTGEWAKLLMEPMDYPVLRSYARGFEAEARLARGWAALLLGDLPSAASEASAAEEISPGQGIDLVHLLGAIQLTRDQQYDEALRIAREGIAALLKPHEIEVGRVEDLPDAIQANAARLAPIALELGEYLMLFATLALLREQPAVAETFSRAAVVMVPASREFTNRAYGHKAALSLGTSLMARATRETDAGLQRTLRQEAVRQLERAAQLNPALGDAYVQLVPLYQALGQAPKAARAQAQADRLASTVPPLMRAVLALYGVGDIGGSDDPRAVQAGRVVALREGFRARPRDPDARRLLTLGLRDLFGAHRAAGDHAAAIEVLEEVLAIAAENSPAWFSAHIDIGATHMATRNYDAAVEVLQATRQAAARQERKGSPVAKDILVQILHNLGLAQLGRGNPAGAEEALTVELRELPGSALANPGRTAMVEHYLATTKYEQGRWAEAETLFIASRAEGLTAELVSDSLMLSGWCAYMQGQYESARDLAVQAGHVASPTLRALAEGRLALIDGRIDEVLEAVEIGARVALRRMGVEVEERWSVEELFGQLTSHSAEATERIRDPSLRALLFLATDAALAGGQPALALACSRMAVDVYPDSLSRRRLGRSLLAVAPTRGEDERPPLYRQAIEALDQAHVADPSDRSIVESLIEASRALGDTEEVEKLTAVLEAWTPEAAARHAELEAALSGTPSELMHYYDLGNFYDALGEFDLAMTIFQRGGVAAESNPVMQAMFLYHLGELSMRHGEHEEAVTYFSEARTMVNSHPTAIDLWWRVHRDGALALGMLERYEAAEEWLRATLPFLDRLIAGRLPEGVRLVAEHRQQFLDRPGAMVDDYRRQLTEARFYLGGNMFYQHRWIEAEEFFAQAMADEEAREEDRRLLSRDQWLSMLAMRAWTLYYLGRFEEVARLAERIEGAADDVMRERRLILSLSRARQQWLAGAPEDVLGTVIDSLAHETVQIGLEPVPAGSARERLGGLLARLETHTEAFRSRIGFEITIECLSAVRALTSALGWVEEYERASALSTELQQSEFARFMWLGAVWITFAPTGILSRERARPKLRAALERLEASPDDPAGLRALAEAGLEESQERLAASMFAQAASREPDAAQRHRDWLAAAEAYENLPFRLMREDGLREAVRWISLAISEMDGGDVKTRLERANLYKRRGMLKVSLGDATAIEDADMVLSLVTEGGRLKDKRASVQGTASVAQRTRGLALMLQANGQEAFSPAQRETYGEALRALRKAMEWTRPMLDASRGNRDLHHEVLTMVHTYRVGLAYASYLLAHAVGDVSTCDRLMGEAAAELRQLRSEATAMELSPTLDALVRGRIAWFAGNRAEAVSVHQQALAAWVAVRTIGKAEKAALNELALPALYERLDAMPLPDTKDERLPEVEIAFALAEELIASEERSQDDLTLALRMLERIERSGPRTTMHVELPYLRGLAHLRMARLSEGVAVREYAESARAWLEAAAAQRSEHRPSAEALLAVAELLGDAALLERSRGAIAAIETREAEARATAEAASAGKSKPERKERVVITGTDPASVRARIRQTLELEHRRREYEGPRGLNVDVERLASERDADTLDVLVTLAGDRGVQAKTKTLGMVVEQLGRHVDVRAEQALTDLLPLWRGLKGQAKSDVRVQAALDAQRTARKVPEAALPVLRERTEVLASACAAAGARCAEALRAGRRDVREALGNVDRVGLGGLPDIVAARTAWEAQVQAAVILLGESLAARLREDHDALAGVTEREQLDAHRRVRIAWNEDVQRIDGTLDLGQGRVIDMGAVVTALRDWEMAFAEAQRRVETRERNQTVRALVERMNAQRTAAGGIMTLADAAGLGEIEREARSLREEAATAKIHEEDPVKQALETLDTAIEAARQRLVEAAAAEEHRIQRAARGDIAALLRGLLPAARAIVWLEALEAHEANGELLWREGVRLGLVREGGRRYARWQHILQRRRHALTAEQRMLDAAKSYEAAETRIAAGELEEFVDGEPDVFDQMLDLIREALALADQAEGETEAQDTHDTALSWAQDGKRLQRVAHLRATFARAHQLLAIAAPAEISQLDALVRARHEQSRQPEDITVRNGMRFFAITPEEELNELLARWAEAVAERRKTLRQALIDALEREISQVREDIEAISRSQQLGPLVGEIRRANELARGIHARLDQATLGPHYSRVVAAYSAMRTALIAVDRRRMRENLIPRLNKALGPASAWLRITVDAPDEATQAEGIQDQVRFTLTAAISADQLGAAVAGVTAVLEQTDELEKQKVLGEYASKGETSEFQGSAAAREELLLLLELINGHPTSDQPQRDTLVQGMVAVLGWHREGFFFGHDEPAEALQWIVEGQRREAIEGGLRWRHAGVATGSQLTLRELVNDAAQLMEAGLWEAVQDQASPVGIAVLAKVPGQPLIVRSADGRETALSDRAAVLSVTWQYLQTTVRWPSAVADQAQRHALLTQALEQGRWSMMRTADRRFGFAPVRRYRHAEYRVSMTVRVGTRGAVEQVQVAATPRYTLEEEELIDLLNFRDERDLANRIIRPLQQHLRTEPRRQRRYDLVIDSSDPDAGNIVLWEELGPDRWVARVLNPRDGSLRAPTSLSGAQVEEYHQPQTPPRYYDLTPLLQPLVARPSSGPPNG
ncbi:MAG: hypothetical protein COV75_03070, partial [Candidatus Omnitrophica bacterium CG11_big_fil_rev_8_21_14_0_20_63_9]